MVGVGNGAGIGVDAGVGKGSGEYVGVDESVTVMVCVGVAGLVTCAVADGVGDPTTFGAFSLGVGVLPSSIHPVNNTNASAVRIVTVSRFFCLNIITPE